MEVCIDDDHRHHAGQLFYIIIIAIGVAEDTSRDMVFPAKQRKLLLVMRNLRGGIQRYNAAAEQEIITDAA